MCEDNSVTGSEGMLKCREGFAAHHEGIELIKFFLKPALVFRRCPTASLLFPARNSAVKRDGGEQSKPQISFLLFHRGV